MQQLSCLRPEIILPPLLERMYQSLETITEPHKLTATMHAVVSCSRSLVYPGNKYPEGPRHVIPLLLETLPGNKKNDISVKIYI